VPEIHLLILALYMCACGLFIVFVFAYLSWLYFFFFLFYASYLFFSSSVSYLPEYGPAPFPGRRSSEATEPGFSLFCVDVAVFLVKDACLFSLSV